jgi:nucleoside-diphosphate-sugar epimerase
MNKRIVIVGGHGFLGSVAARHLDAVNDVDVVVTHRRLQPSTALTSSSTPHRATRHLQLPSRRIV